MIRQALFAGLAAGMLAACTADARASDDDVGATTQATVETITPEALADRIAAGESIQLIDVRTPEEFAQGHLSGAINIPVDRFDPAALPDRQGTARVLYCRSDRRSGIAAGRLAEASGEDAVHLDGGILAWEEADLPVKRD
ncbi:MAG: rhodanese-like domain-containing protein [Erythrobacter sp.]|uniref:rhodanese-like domain-containing protein n=1 Tax=Erythrobacter sp. TaxID=1042 RepID=UPI001B17A8C6|nr:rhodanese-like domain-containing protein [Erythrobacter sp.]MBO6766985.1 rhodanese-like domain-containing protein [Erythrobacter sp.]